MVCLVALADFLTHSLTFLVTAITRRGNQSRATDTESGGVGHSFLYAHHQNCPDGVAQWSEKLLLLFYATVNVPHTVIRQSVHQPRDTGMRRTRTSHMSTTCSRCTLVSIYASEQRSENGRDEEIDLEKYTRGLETWLISHYRLFKTQSTDKQHLILWCRL